MRTSKSLEAALKTANEKLNLCESALENLLALSVEAHKAIQEYKSEVSTFESSGEVVLGTGPDLRFTWLERKDWMNILGSENPLLTLKTYLSLPPVFWNSKKRK